MVTRNGMRCILRRMATSTLLSCGLWFAEISGLNCGLNSKSSCRMKRAVSVSPPVIFFSFASAHRLPSSTSATSTMRAPFSRAISVE